MDFNGLKKALQKPFWILVGFSCVINIMQLALPIYTLQVFDNVLSSQSTDTLLYLTLIVAFAVLIMLVVSYTRGQILLEISQWLNAHLSAKILPQIPHRQVTRDLRHNILLQIQLLKQGVAGPGVVGLFDIPWVPLYLLVLFYLHPLQCLVATIAILALVAVTFISERLTRDYKNDEQSLQEQALTMQQYLAANATDCIAMGMNNPITQRYLDNLADGNSHEQQSQKISQALSQVGKGVRMMAQVGIMGAGAYLVIIQAITPGMMIAGSIILGRALAPVDQLIGQWLALKKIYKAYEIIEQYYAMPEIQQSAIELPEPQGYLTLEQMSYQLGEQTILSEISLDLKPGTLTALIGPSGAGKSTLAKVMVGALAPTAGVARLDAADIYQWDRIEVGKYIGFMSQRTELYQTDVKSIIARLGDLDAKKIIDAAQLAEIHEAILALPHGYDTKLGTGGMNVSDGFRQRIALASALYDKPKLIVLDEPNASLDRQGEEALTKSLEQAKSWGACIVVISHRMEIVKRADTVIVLNQGKITEEISAEKVAQHMSEVRITTQAKQNRNGAKHA